MSLLLMSSMALIGTQGVEPQGCLRAGEALSGELRYVESRHPNGTNLRYGFLVTPEPVCVVVESIEPAEPYVIRGRWIQISYADDQIGGHPNPGDQIVITANYDDVPTAWYLGDFTAFNARIISREPM